MKSTRLPTHYCATCKTKLSAASSVGGDFTPKPGNLTICIDCGALLRFRADLQVELAPVELEQQLDEAGTKMLALIRETARRGAGPGRQLPLVSWELARQEGERRMWMLPVAVDPRQLISLTRFPNGAWALAILPFAGALLDEQAVDALLDLSGFPPRPVIGEVADAG